MALGCANERRASEPAYCEIEAEKECWKYLKDKKRNRICRLGSGQRPGNSKLTAALSPSPISWAEILALSLEQGQVAYLRSCISLLQR